MGCNSPPSSGKPCVNLCRLIPLCPHPTTLRPIAKPSRPTRPSNNISVISRLMCRTTENLCLSLAEFAYNNSCHSVQTNHRSGPTMASTLHSCSWEPLTRRSLRCRTSCTFWQAIRSFSRTPRPKPTQMIKSSSTVNIGVTHVLNRVTGCRSL